jgi:ABC-type multidrug transport system fused ATPase/permease subunit
VCIIFMTGGVFAYLSLAYYLDKVLPSEFGVRRPWYFPVTDLISMYKKKQRMKHNDGVDPKSEAAMAINIAVDENEVKFEDDDVRAERGKVLSDKFDHSGYPLIMKNMRKVYAGRGGAGPKLAVKDVTLAVEKNTVFGLLGPNGAGKTTLISILTGLYPASTGAASIAGFNIKNDTESVYQNIGICPQVY